jgi:hypothetical protein
MTKHQTWSILIKLKSTFLDWPLVWNVSYQKFCAPIEQDSYLNWMIRFRLYTQLQILINSKHWLFTQPWTALITDSTGFRNHTQKMRLEFRKADIFTGFRTSPN